MDRVDELNSGAHGCPVPVTNPTIFIEQPTQLATNAPAPFGLSFFAKLLFAALLANGNQEFIWDTYR
ncbi:MAG: hypothetical protein QGD96_13350 [Anaerolineae bacterium]|nr:hypothetical protein [Anaerolineae bacterium]